MLSRKKLFTAAFCLAACSGSLHATTLRPSDDAGTATGGTAETFLFKGKIVMLTPSVLIIGSSGSIEAHGGDGGLSSATTTAGGGGSGGVVHVLSVNSFAPAASVNVAGAPAPVRQEIAKTTQQKGAEASPPPIRLLDDPVLRQVEEEVLDGIFRFFDFKAAAPRKDVQRQPVILVQTLPGVPGVGRGPAVLGCHQHDRPTGGREAGRARFTKEN